ncbi:hypothetical protein [Reinekea sp.]|jgi:hypothetical protein|uniref:hypothetical protein n=1 Tax=Reinekea sp. TaxID=1970455 RepID=UPI002A7F0AD7|nr:hypothetical protein [Reinekea sp.]
MNLDKAQKRISKRANKGFQGFPQLIITYSGPNDDLATRVDISFIAEENSAAQVQTFNTQAEIRSDETIQTTLVKIMDRSEAATVSLTVGVQALN